MFSLKAYAKINWTLDILGSREDGYHLMDMLMQAISLHDTLTFEPADTLRLFGTQKKTADIASPSLVPFDERNLVIKTAKKLQDYTSTAKGAMITLEKNIPAGAGLGGGSADAAATLIGLNQLWNLGLSHQVLEEIALQIGADVPFLLRGGLARVKGIGEVLTALTPAPCYHLVLLQPCEGLSTREVFAGFDAVPLHEQKHPQTDVAQQALLTCQTSVLAEAMHNVLQPVSLPYRPTMQTAIDDLIAKGAIHAMMTGSGSVVYGVFDDAKKASNAHQALLASYDPCILCHTITGGVSQ